MNAIVVANQAEKATIIIVAARCNHTFNGGNVYCFSRNKNNLLGIFSHGLNPVRRLNWLTVAKISIVLSESIV